MQERNTTEQWYRLRRLELAGMLLPHPPAEPNYPLRVEHLAPTLEHDIFPTLDGVGVAIFVRITGATRITIKNYRLCWGEVKTTRSELTPLAPCPLCSRKGEPRYCFSLLTGHQTISKTEKVWDGGTLKRDDSVRRCFLGLLPPQYRFPALLIPATLDVFDPLGNYYPYPLHLKVSPELKSS